MKLERALKIKKHIPYKLLTFIIKKKEEKRNKYNLSVDYRKNHPIKEMKKALIDNAKEINAFMETINTNNYPDLQSEEEIENLKDTFITKALYFFTDEDLTDIFSHIEPMNFNTKRDNVLIELPGVVLEKSKNISNYFEKKEDCLSYFDDLRSFFDYVFLKKHQISVYGVHEQSQKFDLFKIELFYRRNVFSSDFINEIEKENKKSYFQKHYYNHYYWGVISYKIVKDTWSKLK